MWIESSLNKDLCFVNVDGISKKRAIEFIAEKFAEHFDDVDASTLFMHLIGREKLGSTGIGDGIAIPHCRFPTNDRTFCMCIQLSAPIDYDSVDHKPVDIIFAMVVPEESEENHLEHLAELAGALQTPGYVSKLRAAKAPEDLYLAATHI